MQNTESHVYLGNHDYGDYKRWSSPEAKENNMLQLYDFYSGLGWKLLRNENYSLKRGEDEISILGVENWGSYKRFQKYGNLEEAFRGSENASVRILLSHDPSHFARKVKNFHSTIDLTLSGHTHGGQLGFEIPGLRWSPVEYMYKYWAGLYTVSNKVTGTTQHLYVNRGIGSIGYPGRVGIFPEITVIELMA